MLKISPPVRQVMAITLAAVMLTACGTTSAPAPVNPESSGAPEPNYFDPTVARRATQELADRLGSTEILDIKINRAWMQLVAVRDGKAWITGTIAGGQDGSSPWIDAVEWNGVSQPQPLREIDLGKVISLSNACPNPTLTIHTWGTGVRWVARSCSESARAEPFWLDDGTPLTVDPNSATSLASLFKRLSNDYPKPIEISVTSGGTPSVVMDGPSPNLGSITISGNPKGFTQTVEILPSVASNLDGDAGIINLDKFSPETLVDCSTQMLGRNAQRTPWAAWIRSEGTKSTIAWYDQEVPVEKVPNNCSSF